MWGFKTIFVCFEKKSQKIIAYKIDFQFNGRTIFLFCFWTHMSKNQNSFEILPFYLVQGEDL